MRLNRFILFGVITTAMGTTGVALAQTDTENPPSTPPDTQVQPTPETAEPPAMTLPAAPTPIVAPVAAPPTADVGAPPPHARWMPSSGVGVSLFAGGGVTDYTQSATRNETNTGGSWDARLIIGTRSIVAFDGSYIGGANTISGLGNGHATLVRNGVEGALRINAPLYASDTLLEPYIFGGVGWNGYTVTNLNSATLASVTTGTDSTLSVPAGVGFMVGYHGLVADLRYTIRPTFDQNIFVNESNTALTNWDAGGMIGFEF